MCQFKSGLVRRVDESTVEVLMLPFEDSHEKLREHFGGLRDTNGLARFVAPVEYVPIRSAKDDPEDWKFKFNAERPEWWTDGMTEQARDQMHRAAISQIKEACVTGWKWSADFRSLTSAAGLENLATIGGSAFFGSLTSAAGLEKLATIGGFADFRSLTSAAGLEELATIGGSANFCSLTSAAGLEKLATIGEFADFCSLTSAAGLEKLATIGGFADFGSLTSAATLQERVGKAGKKTAASDPLPSGVVPTDALPL